MTEWEWFSNSQMVHLFIYLLLKANNTVKSWQGMTIARGQFITSQPTLCADLHFPRQTLRTCLNRLEATKEIVVKSTNKFTLITICKYDDYQCLDTPSLTNEQPSTNHQLTIKQPSTNHQLTITKETKETKETREIEDSSLRSESMLASNARSKKSVSSVSEVLVSTEDGCTDGEIDTTALMEFFNRTMDGKQIPGIVKMTERRVSATRARARDYGREAIAKVIRAAAESSFLNGNGTKGFTASFDWIFRPNNFVKILEGNYNDNPLTPRPDNGHTNAVLTHNEAESNRTHREAEWIDHVRTALANPQAEANPFSLADG